MRREAGRPAAAIEIKLAARGMALLGLSSRRRPPAWQASSQMKASSAAMRCNPNVARNPPDILIIARGAVMLLLAVDK